jgi:hypothetical protein
MLLHNCVLLAALFYNPHGFRIVAGMALNHEFSRKAFTFISASNVVYHFVWLVGLLVGLFVDSFFISYL